MNKKPTSIMLWASPLLVAAALYGRLQWYKQAARQVETPSSRDYQDHADAVGKLLDEGAFEDACHLIRSRPELTKPRTEYLSNPELPYNSLNYHVVKCNRQDVLLALLSTGVDETDFSAEKVIKLKSDVTLKYLLDRGWDPNDRRGLLTFACSHSRPIAHLLLDYGADPDGDTPYNTGSGSPIEQVVRSKSPNSEVVPLMRRLLEAGGNPDTGRNHETPLAAAVTICDPERTQLLLDYGADVNFHDVPLLTIACIKGKFPEKREDAAKVLRLLIDHGADLDRQFMLGKPVRSYILADDDLRKLVGKLPP